MRGDELIERVAERPVIAVVPFGARARDGRTGAWARQIARRLVERFAGEAGLELREVFLVAVPETGSDAGYLVVGSTPDVDLASSYGASLGCTHALVGAYRETDDARSLDLVLAEVAGSREVARDALAIPPGALQETEGDLAAWLAARFGLAVEPRAPAAANEEAYGALLEGLDEEMNATLLAGGNAAAAAEAASRANRRFLDALRADPACRAAEDRILVRAAESIERGEEAREIPALEELTSIVPRSWRGHYLLGELRRIAGETAGAIVALEHAHALRALPDADLVRLAGLYVAAGSPKPAIAHLRRVLAGPATREVAAQARRLQFSLLHPELERALERAGAAAASGDEGALDDARATFARVIAAQPDLWEAHFGAGLVARQRGDAAEAQRAFRRVLEIWPEQPDARELLEAARADAEAGPRA